MTCHVLRVVKIMVFRFALTALEVTLDIFLLNMQKRMHFFYLEILFPNPQ